MKLVGNLRIGTKLFLGFGLCIVLACVVGAIAIAGMGRMNVAAGLISSDALQGTHDLGALDSSLLKARSDYYQVLYTADAASKQKLVDAADGEFKDIKGASDSYGKSISQPEDQKNFDQLKGDVDKYIADAGALKELQTAGN